MLETAQLFQLCCDSMMALELKTGTTDLGRGGRAQVILVAADKIMRMDYSRRRRRKQESYISRHICSPVGCLFTQSVQPSVCMEQQFDGFYEIRCWRTYEKLKNIYVFM